MVRNKLSEFVIETARFITSTADVSPELQQLRYCLCSVARQCGQQLGQALPAAFPDKASGVHEGREAQPGCQASCMLQVRSVAASLQPLPLCRVRL